MAAQGLVIKKQGKGTFVAEKSADHMVGPLISSSEVFLLNNYNIKTTVIKAKKKVPGKRICKFLQLPDTGEDEIYYLERVRYANETPVAHIQYSTPVYPGWVLIMKKRLRPIIQVLPLSSFSY